MDTKEMMCTNSPTETSSSDNSHLFGVPFVIHSEEHATLTIRRGDLRKWVLQTANLPIEFHLSFVKTGKNEE